MKEDTRQDIKEMAMCTKHGLTTHIFIENDTGIGICEKCFCEYFGEPYPQLNYEMQDSF